MNRSAIACAVLLYPSLALAGGFEYPDVGTVAQGRAAAFTATANDGTAIYYNPAGLADQAGWNVTFDLTLGNQSTSFQRTDAAGDVFPTVSNAAGLFFIPFISVSRGFDLGAFGKLAVAAGLYAPPGNGGLAFPNETPPVLSNLQKRAFGVNGCNTPPAPTAAGVCPGATTGSLTSAPQKYSFVSQNILIVYPTLSAAWQPIPILSVGASLQLLISNVQNRQATYDGASYESGGHTAANEQLTYDTMANLDVSGTTVNANFGVKLTPWRGLKIGASYKPKSTLNQSGTLKLDFSPFAQSKGTTVVGAGTVNAADGSSGQGPVTLSNSFPSELKTGVGYDFGRFDVEADFNYTTWSDYKAATITPQFSTNAGAVPPLIVTRDFQDTWSVRLGGEVKIPVPAVGLKVRAGLGYESSMYNTSQPQYVSVDYANFDQYWGALGASVTVGMFDFDLSYSHVYMPTHTVTNSGVTASENNAPAGTPAFVIGNGTYNTSYDLLALGARAHF